MNDVKPREFWIVSDSMVGTHPQFIINTRRFEYAGHEVIHVREVLPGPAMTGVQYLTTKVVEALNSKRELAIGVMVAALEKIEDPRKRDHKEPDKYTEVGCMMNIAAEALEVWREANQ